MAAKFGTLDQESEASPPGEPSLAQASDASSDGNAYESSDFHEDADGDDRELYDQYRTLSISAVVTLLLGILSLSALLVQFLLIIPAMGTALGIFALWAVRTRRDELSGQRVAVAGLAMCVVLLVVGTGWHWWWNRVVPPEGDYQPLAFWELQPDEEINIQELSRVRSEEIALPLPEKALALDGKKVFIAGYIYPGEKRQGLDQFVLVADMGTCCFGGQPKLTDMIEVKLKEPLKTDFSYRRRGLGGVLRVHKSMQSRNELLGVVYELEADYLY